MVDDVSAWFEAAPEWQLAIVAAVIAFVVMAAVFKVLGRKKKKKSGGRK